jgi:hypothetical protein
LVTLKIYSLHIDVYFMSLFHILFFIIFLFQVLVSYFCFGAASPITILSPSLNVCAFLYRCSFRVSHRCYFYYIQHHRFSILFQFHFSFIFFSLSCLLFIFLYISLSHACTRWCNPGIYWGLTKCWEVSNLMSPLFGNSQVVSKSLYIILKFTIFFLFFWSQEWAIIIQK